MTVRRALSIAALLVLLVQGIATAHEERPSQFPDGTGSVPKYRQSGPSIVVCKNSSARRIRQLPAALRSYNQQLFARCQYHDIQAAVDAVTKQGTRILVLPGVYSEKPSTAPLSEECAPLADKRANGDGPLTYEEQKRCPHVENLIGIFGDDPADEDIKCDNALCGLQIEGTGKKPLDVVIDGKFAKLNAIRADRADGAYFRNFTVERSEFNSLYVIETDGYAIDRVLARWNDEYGFLTFSSDHGLYQDCEAYGNGDSGIYPGSASDLPAGTRPAVEIRRCRSHHNTLGLSGTAGNNIYAHNNRFYKNIAGVSLDSFFPNHPGLPQDSSTFVHNLVYSNNQDYYQYYRDGTCADMTEARKRFEEGVVCPSVPMAIGTGFFLAGGNENVYRENRVWNNWRFGAMQFWVPAYFHGDDDPTHQNDTSNFNRYVKNIMGVTPGGSVKPNGKDFSWDVEGAGNCWQDNVAAPGRDITYQPPTPEVFPTCDDPTKDEFRPAPLVSQYGSCATWSRENYEPPGCDWMQRPAKPE
ncbi:MAG TPA: right-handed parallel beta-helix repeat-containing protein [Actinomycetota bacterium]